jgi:RHH-type proline utilization regulon transcriptional repressor/proline dehydrogenase/delta 1-pyrroline-5-carboxylate dehydrogenase
MAAVSPLKLDLEALRVRMRAAGLLDEPRLVRELASSLAAAEPALVRARSVAAGWVRAARARPPKRSFLEEILEHAPLDSAHGKALMSLAEALLRTPDDTRADQLVAERLAQFRSSRERDEGKLAIRSTFALLGAAGSLLPDVESELGGGRSLKGLTKPLVAPIARAALRKAMHAMSGVFIAGETIETALRSGRSHPGLALCSFDMLGEGARTDADARRYLDAYAAAIEALAGQPQATLHERSGISIKLSALEPRYSLTQPQRLRERLIPQVVELARAAARAGIGFTVDAEEADRLDISLDVIEALARDEQTLSWPGLGLAVQAYGRRATFVVDWVATLARATGRRMTVRLVKGAYWDTEVKASRCSPPRLRPTSVTWRARAVCSRIRM